MHIPIYKYNICISCQLNANLINSFHYIVAYIHTYIHTNSLFSNFSLYICMYVCVHTFIWYRNYFNCIIFSMPLTLQRGAKTSSNYMSPFIYIVSFNNFPNTKFLTSLTISSFFNNFKFFKTILFKQKLKKFFF